MFTIPPPESVGRYIKAFWNDPFAHQYGPVEGLDALREAISLKLSNENKINLNGREIAVTAGSNMGFLNMLLAIADPGDQVILPKPFYFNQEMAVRIANCDPVTVNTKTDGHLDLAAIESVLTDRTRAVVTVSPNNPTGVVYREEDLRAVNALCKRGGFTTSAMRPMSTFFMMEISIFLRHRLLEVKITRSRFCL